MFDPTHSPEIKSPALRRLSRLSVLHGTPKTVPGIVRYRKPRRGRYRARHPRPAN